MEVINGIESKDGLFTDFFGLFAFHLTLWFKTLPPSSYVKIQIQIQIILSLHHIQTHKQIMALLHTSLLVLN